MNRTAFHRRAAIVALLAALLLALLPAAGRMAGAAAHHEAMAAMAPHAAPAADAHGHGGSPAHAGRHDGHAAPGTPTPPPAPDSAADCDYCPLLGALVVLTQPAAADFLHMLPPAEAAGPATPRVARRHPSGLGSRGPPRTA